MGDVVEYPRTIWRESILTPKGNRLSFFYNSENDLVVVDLVHRSEAGGNEFVRVTLDEDKMLRHCEEDYGKEGQAT